MNILSESLLAALSLLLTLVALYASDFHILLVSGHHKQVIYAVHT